MGFQNTAQTKVTSTKPPLSVAPPAAGPQETIGERLKAFLANVAR